MESPGDECISVLRIGMSRGTCGIRLSSGGKSLTVVDMSTRIRQLDEKSDLCFVQEEIIPTATNGWDTQKKVEGVRHRVLDFGGSKMRRQIDRISIFRSMSAIFHPLTA